MNLPGFAATGGLRRMALACLLIGVGCPPVAVAQNRDAAVITARSVLVRNVVLINQPDQAGDVLVSLLIRAGELEVVTQDAVATDAADLALDAAGGILVGNLQTGEPASFLILEGDPREDIQVLLDTARTVSFAVAKGEIVRNRLARAFDADDAPRRSAWLAYTPPPLAMPTDYRDTSKFNRWETRFLSGIFAAGLVLDRQNWQSQDDASEFQVGDLREFDGGEIRGLRFGAVGTLNFAKPWVYTVFAATNAFDQGFDSDEDDDLTFFDWRLDVPIFSETTLSIGKQKEPISMERLMSLAYNPMQERAAVSDALLPARNVGLVLSGNALGRRLTWAAGAFNDWLEDGGSPGDNATQFIGRTSLVPWASPDDSNLFHLGLGFRYSNARQGFSVATEPEFNQSPLFVDTLPFESDDLNLYNVEASWRRGPVWLHGEYNWADVRNEVLGDPRVTGYHLTVSWALTGEMRRYNRRNGLFDRLPVARSVYQNGWGSWELATRWSSLDATDGGLDGGELDILSAGVNWWLTPFFHVSFNYRWITLDRLGVSGDSHGFNSRVMLLLE